MPFSQRHKKMQAEFSERSYLQWALIRSIAFAERDWMLVTCILFWFDKTRDFLTVPGVLFFLLGLFSVGPVGGVFIYGTNKAIYRILRRRGWVPRSFWELKRISWACNIFWFPLMLLAGAGAFNLFFQSYDGILSWPQGL